MLESAELGAQVSKEEFEAAVPDLRVDLLNMQFDLREAGFSVLLVVMGNSGEAVNELINLLDDWLDARYLRMCAFDAPAGAELERPRFWRYWRDLPPNGRIGVHVGAWPLVALDERLAGDLDDGAFERRLAQIARFERELAVDGTLVVKLWLHVPYKEWRKHQKRQRRSSRPWRRDPHWERLDRHYEELTAAAEELLRETSTAEAPWSVIEASDERHRDLTAARVLLDAVTARLREGGPASVAAPVATSFPDVLASLDLGSRLEREAYRERRDALQRRLVRRMDRAHEKGRSLVAVFEGFDAAGKGGCIRRITRPLDIRDYRVLPIGAPSEEERSRHWLWRFWRDLPGAGEIVVFDRSWYGRVLVERVEGFASEAEWRRAYAEIVDFEEQIVEHGVPVVKFWLHVDADEQLRRFRERAQTPYKKYKLTEDDLRNRGRWDDYVGAVNEMVARTSTNIAPWHLVPANDKRFARVEVLERVCEALESVT